MIKVFLGGTCNGSTWRSELVKLLYINYFNPVVDDWTEECMEEEIRQRQLCNFSLYVVTPEMTGVYSIAEVVDDSNKRPKYTIFCILQRYNNLQFSDSEMRSLQNVGKMIVRNGGFYVNSLKEVANILNNINED